MTQRHWRVVISLVVLALALWAIFSMERHRLASESGTSPQQYTNLQYGYAFQYPAAYAVREYTPQYVAVADPSAGTDADRVDVTVGTAADHTAAEDFDSFAHAQARRSCDADGVSGSVHCPSVTRTERYTTAGGLTGEVFYLERVETAGTSTTRREAGPFYAFNISANDPETRYTVLLVHPTHAAEESAAYDTGAALSRSIVDSLIINKK